MSKQDTEEAKSGKITKYLAQTIEDDIYYLFLDIKENIYQETDYLTILPDHPKYSSTSPDSEDSEYEMQRNFRPSGSGTRHRQEEKKKKKQ